MAAQCQLPNERMDGFCLRTDMIFEFKKNISAIIYFIAECYIVTKATDL